MSNKTHTLLSQKRRYLLACDFDGTLFDTFSPSPNGIDVRKAYGLAISHILGEKGTRLYDTFTLGNRAPLELIKEMFKWFNPENNDFYVTDKEYRDEMDEAYRELMNYAFNFFKMEGSKIQSFVPECKNGKFEWNNKAPLETIAQMLVGLKLMYLMDEIGQENNRGEIWPLPCENALEFLHTAQVLKRDGVPIDIAIVSSGHELFIRKTLNTWQVPQPDIMITDDDIRPRKYPTEIQRRFKPGQLPLALAHFEWLKLQGLTVEDDKFMQNAAESKNRMLYIGDDPIKDMSMALDAGVKGFLSTTRPLELLKYKDLFDGRPFAEIINHAKKERELITINNEGPSLGLYARR